MKFIATVEDSHRDKIQDIASNLEGKGIKVDRVLKFTGVIIGYVDNLDDVKIEGIRSAEFVNQVKIVNKK